MHRQFKWGPEPCNGNLGGTGNLPVLAGYQPASVGRSTGQYYSRRPNYTGQNSSLASFSSAESFPPLGPGRIICTTQLRKGGAGGAGAMRWKSGWNGQPALSYGLPARKCRTEHRSVFFA